MTRAALLVALVLGAAGCGGASGEQVTRYTITGSGLMVAEAHNALLPGFVERSDECEAESETVDAYRDCLGAWYDAQRWLQAAASALYAAEAAFDAYEAGEDSDWAGALACARDTVLQALAALADVGVRWEAGEEFLSGLTDFVGVCADPVEVSP